MTKSPDLSPDERRLARMLKALGSPVRMQIVTFMAEHPTCMTRQIVASTPLAQSTVSQHLKVLRDAGLIQGEIEGPATCYCLDPGGFHWLEQHLQAWIRRQDPTRVVFEPTARAGQRR